MEVLGSRILLRPSDSGRSHRFYRETLGLAVYREFGSPESPGVVYFLGNGFLEISGQSHGTRGTDAQGSGVALWLQVRDIQREHERLLAAAVPVIRGPVQEPWGLLEMWINDPDGVPIVIVEVPEGHPLRRDQR